VGLVVSRDTIIPTSRRFFFCGQYSQKCATDSTVERIMTSVLIGVVRNLYTE
jgi:hypothetical protein